MWKTLKSAVKRRLRTHPHLEQLFRIAYYRGYRARRTGYPDWDRILRSDRAAWDSAREASRPGPRVLVATSVGGYLAGITLESVLGVALTLRGARVETLLCDETLPACFDSQMFWFPDPGRFAAEGPRRLCGTCYGPARRLYESLGFPVNKLGDSITAEERASCARLAASMSAADIPAFRMDGVAVGEHALAGALRFFARATLDGEPSGEAVLRRYFHAALLTAHAARRLLESGRFDVVVFNHGIYVPQGILGEVARQKGVRVVNWNPAYRKRCFIFSHNDTYHHTLMNEPAAAWETLELTPALDAALDEYLASRWRGTEDWIWFHEDPVFDEDLIAKETGVDFSKPCVGLLTNVMWDAQLHYPANAFPDMRTWLLRTIDHFSRRPDLQLLIRVHPAEIRGTLPSRQPVVKEIRSAYPVLPSNVFVVPPESRVSTYAVMRRCGAVVIYGTKTGVELTSLGVPVVVAGEAWIRNKGITLDADSPQGYFRILDGLPFARPLDEALRRRARKYAYHFFFRRMIPLEFMTMNLWDPPFRVTADGLDAFRPGRSKGLDVICDGILQGTDFVYPAEGVVAPRRESVPAI